MDRNDVTPESSQTNGTSPQESDKVASVKVQRANQNIEVSSDLIYRAASVDAS